MADSTKCDPILEQQWRQRVADWKASGQSVREFCKSASVPESSFYAWRRELEKRDGLIAASSWKQPFAAVKIHLCKTPTDMCKSFDSLAALAQTVIGQDPRSGHFFVFRSRRGDRIKILVWDRDGFAIWMKRLEAGTFNFPESDADHVTLTPTELAMILGGIDLARTRQRKRYSAPMPSPS